MTVDTGDKAYVNAQDTLYSYLGIMRCMQDVAERQVILGEIRGDLVSSTEYATDTLYAISNFDDPKDQSCSMLQVSDYYNVINNCNFYIQNADTSAIKSNVKYMIPEYAQVKAIRAWAYLQLVKNYGEVPYISEPVSNLDVIKNFDYEHNLVNKDNLIDKLLQDGLEQFIDTRYPQYGSGSTTYGSWSNGYTDISARMCYIPVRVLLGDLYLLRGNSTSDYEKAAKYYYDFLKSENTPLYKQYCTVSSIMSTGKLYYSSSNSWGRWASTYTYTAATNEVTTVIPGSANAGLGKMLTRVADIYGYTTTSSQSSDAGSTSDGSTATDANGSTTYETSGAISVTRNYKRQYCPSNAYKSCNDEQTYVNYQSRNASSGENIVSYINNCDARYGNSVEDFTYTLNGVGDSYPLCCKAAKGTAFYYTIPIYRKSLIWLRLAEAINRAGYPEYAFAILKDGLNQYTRPTMFTDNYLQPTVTEIEGTKYYSYQNTDGVVIYKEAEGESETYWTKDESGKLVEFTDKVTNKFKQENDTIYFRNYHNNSTCGACYYISDTLQIVNFNNFLDFSDDVWNATYGIHAKGAGMGSWTSSNENEVTTNISGYRDSVYYDYERLIAAQGVKIAKDGSNKADVINAMENIIVDELALETAFEGNRFTDLVRIAEHKNASGYEGTKWLANKIASRNHYPKNDTYSEQGSFDQTIYNKLLDTKKWYFTLPTWTVK